jgi:hypothetical protein
MRFALCKVFMSDHYSNIYDTLRSQEIKQMRKEIKAKISKLSHEELLLLDMIVSDLELYKNFFEAIKKISKIEM